MQTNTDLRVGLFFYSLESHNLSNKLSWLLSDRSHLESCYEPFAFLTRQKHSEAALICLRAVEQGQPSLLNDLDPRLVRTINCFHLLTED